MYGLASSGVVSAAADAAPRQPPQPPQQEQPPPPQRPPAAAAASSGGGVHLPEATPLLACAVAGLAVCAVWVRRRHRTRRRPAPPLGAPMTITEALLSSHCGTITETEPGWSAPYFSWRTQERVARGAKYAASVSSYSVTSSH